MTSIGNSKINTAINLITIASLVFVAECKKRSDPSADKLYSVTKATDSTDSNTSDVSFELATACDDKGDVNFPLDNSFPENRTFLKAIDPQIKDNELVSLVFSACFAADYDTDNGEVTKSDKDQTTRTDTSTNSELGLFGLPKASNSIDNAGLPPSGLQTAEERSLYGEAKQDNKSLQMTYKGQNITKDAIVKNEMVFRGMTLPDESVAKSMFNSGMVSGYFYHKLKGKDADATKTTDIFWHQESAHATHTVYVSTSDSPKIADEFMESGEGGEYFMFVIRSKNGIHVNKLASKFTENTKRWKRDPKYQAKLAREEEVVIPGMVKPKYIKGYYKYRKDESSGELLMSDYVLNPNYKEPRLIVRFLNMFK